MQRLQQQQEQKQKQKQQQKNDKDSKDNKTEAGEKTPGLGQRKTNNTGDKQTPSKTPSRKNSKKETPREEQGQYIGRVSVAEQKEQRCGKYLWLYLKLGGRP